MVGFIVGFILVPAERENVAVSTKGSSRSKGLSVKLGSEVAEVSRQEAKLAQQTLSLRLGAFARGPVCVTALSRYFASQLNIHSLP
jgi:hypothetical protein